MSRIRLPLFAGALLMALLALAALASVPAAAADAAVAPASTFSAQINGTDEAPPNTWCTWTGSASGGTPPYTFAWIAVGTGLYGENINGNTYEAIASHGAIDLWMTVRDSNGGYIELNKRIGISSYGSC